MITDPQEIAEELNRRLMNAPRVDVAGKSWKRPVKAMECHDGFSVSVQAHHGAYCSPRDSVGPWFRFELGFPSAPMPEMATWCEAEDKNETETVWGYVPADDVVALIVRHGGLVREWSAD